MVDQAVIKDKLIKKLKSISDDREFILSVINHAWHIDDRKAIINYIDNDKNVNYESIILLSISLYENREKRE